MSDRELVLDRALSGAEHPTDPEVRSLVEAGEHLQAFFNVEVPSYGAQRAMFARAVADRRRPLAWARALAPATITACAVIVVLLLGRTALPGQAFYPVRQVLRSVGLAPVTQAEVSEMIERAELLLTRAESIFDKNDTQAKALAIEAVQLLGGAEQLLADLDRDQAERLADNIQVLLERAEAILIVGVPEDLDDEDRDKAILRDDEDEDGEGEDGDDDPDSTRSGNNDRNTDDRSGENRGEEDRDDNDGDDDDRDGDDGDGDRTDGDDGDHDSGSGSGSSGSGSGDDDDDTVDEPDEEPEDLEDEAEELEEEDGG